MNRSTPRRAGTGVAGALAVVLAAGCASQSARTPSAEASRHAVAARVLSLVDADGIPVENDYIHCVGAIDGGSDDCTGITSSEPVQKITGRFVAFTGQTGSGCPGTLVVDIGPSPGYLDSKGPVHTLTTVTEDPCH